MEVFYNELSNYPLANDKSGAKEKVINLLKALKELKEKGFNILRTHQNFYGDPICIDYSFSEFLNDDTVSRTLKILLQSTTAYPFIVDDDSVEAENFIMNSFFTKDHNGNDVSPEGIASAHIFNSPTVSLTDGIHWMNEMLPLVIQDNSNGTVEAVSVVNISMANSVHSPYFNDWLNSLTSGLQLNSRDNISKAFPSDLFEFDDRAIHDILFWYYDDKRYIVRITQLINDIPDHPFTGGIGKTETLAGTGGRASKRIVKKDRIVYTYTDGKIIIHQCRGHYDDT